MKELIYTVRQRPSNGMWLWELKIDFSQRALATGPEFFSEDGAKHAVESLQRMLDTSVRVDWES